MKRKGILGGIIVVVLALVLALAVGGGSVSAEEPTIIASGDCGKAGSNVTWTLDSTGLLTISGEGEMEDYYRKIDDSHSFTTPPWKKEWNIQKLRIQEGIISIGGGAFYGCTGLTSVAIPDSVTSIGDWAFEGCNNIEKVHISDIAAWCGIVFENYYSNPLSYASDLYVNDALVTDLTIPNGVTSIGSYTFKGCTGLTSVTIGNGVTSIGSYAFKDCTGLTSVTIGNGVTSIGDEAFEDCNNIEKVHISDIAAWCGIVFENYYSNPLSYASDLYVNDALVTDLTIPNGVTSIGSYAFKDCKGLTSVTIGNGVTSIGSYAFYDCIGLTSVTIGNSVTSIGNYAFEYCRGLTSVTIGNSVTSIGVFAFDRCTKLRDITIPNSVASIGGGAFYGCTGLTSVTIPNSVTSIGGSAFSGCTGLASASIGNSVTSIGDKAFSGCTGLTSMTIPDSVTSMGVQAFSGCTGLTCVSIGNSVASIGVYAFEDCSNLTSVYFNANECADFDIGSNVFCKAGKKTEGMTITFGKNVKNIPSYLCCGSEYDSYTKRYYYSFVHAPHVKKIIIGDGVQNIGRFAFYDIGSLTEIIYNAKAVADLKSDSYVFNEAGFPYGFQVQFGDGVERIPAYLFYNCRGLTNMTIGNGVTSIGVGAFEGCTGLTSVTIPDSVTSIGGGAFEGCTGLTSVTIPDSVTSIDTYAFKDCTRLTSVTIPDSVTSIWFGAFEGCTGLASVTIPDSVTSIDTYAFKDCRGLTNMTIGNGVTSIGDGAFEGCTGLTSVTIPDSVTSVGFGAFEGCTSLTSVTIPDSVTSIGTYAFKGCTGLTNVYFNAKQCTDFNIDSNVFYDAGKNSEGITITFGKDVQNIPNYFSYVSVSFNSGTSYRFLSDNAPKVKEIIIENGVQHIGNYAFYGCTGLTSVTVPDSVTSVGNYAFCGCTGLTSVTVPDSVTSIGGSAFSGCTGLTSVTIGNSVTCIGGSAFSGCTGLTCVSIGNSVTSIGEDAFSGCTGLTCVTIPDSVTSIGGSAFSGCTGLASASIGNSVTSIGDKAFSGCTGLTGITIPDSVISIGNLAFKDCTGLAEVLYNAKSAEDLQYSSYGYVFDNAGTSAGGLRVVFGDGVEKIPSRLFSGCTGLTSVEIPNSVTSIGTYAFHGCTGLTSVTIPDSVTNIGTYVFSGCTGLTSVKIGNGVTSIGERAFTGCTGLTSVTIPDSVTSIGEYAFRGCKGLTSVTIGNGVSSIGSYAFFDCSNLTSVYFNANECANFKEYSNVFSNAGKNTEGMTIIFGKNVKNIPSYLCYASEYNSYAKYYYYSSDYAPKVKDIIIENGVQHIGNYAFYGCTGLTSVTIPSSVESIGSLAFSNCSQLKDIFYGGSELAWKLRFSNVSVSGNTTVHFEQPTGQILVSGNCGTDGDNLTWTINDRGNLTVSGKGAMKDYTQSYINYQYVNTSPWGNYAKYLYSAVIENGVTSIGDYAFAFCKNLKSVTIGEDVSNFGSCAFRECSNLEELNYNAKAAADLGTSEYVFDCAGNSGNGICVWVGERVKKIPRDLFCGAAMYFSNHANLRCVFFKGNPPIIDGIGLVSSRSSVYAFYPYGNSEWTASARNSYGSKLIWSAYSDAPATAVSCKTNKTVYLAGETLDVSHLVMTVTHEDGCVETIPYASGLLTLGEYDLTTPGAKLIPVTGRGAEGKLSIYVHEQKTETLDKTGYPESSHDYENNLDKTYTYTETDAISLDVTFSEQTEVETNIDYLYVNGTKYTGTELAGKTITISGDTLTIRLVSDKSDSAYGFSIDSIVKTYMGHEYEDTVVPPTCTERGYTLRSCPCGSVVKQNYVDALGHDMVTDAAVAPTCTKTGLTEGSHCARCDEATTAQKVVPALGHDMVTDAAVAPTCMKTGLTEGSHCSRCDEATTAQKVLPALGHDTVTDAAVAPTCTKTGLTEGSHCSRCGETIVEQKVVPALGHDMVTDAAVAPTCTKTGLTEGSHCSRCDEMITEQKVVPALGHDMVTDAAVAPTCTKTGLTEGSHCSRCDEATTAQKVVPALGHDMVTDAAVAPTCTKTGLTEGSHCSRCDDQTTAQEVIPARGHRFNARHICMVCGVEDPVVEITLKKLPTKASYVVNKEALDVAGGVVLSHYESGETEELELTAAMVSGFDNTILGKQTLTVTVGGLTTTFEVEVVERAVTSVAVENGKLVKHYTDGTTEETPLKDGAISDFAISETGEKTLTLTSENACVAAYKDADGNYVALKAVANEDGSYSYVVPEEVTEVTVAVKGDLDGDGLINMKDLARLRHDMADGTGEDGLTRLIIDLDGDGIVNMKDMGLLRRYLAGGYDIELGW